MLVVAVAAKLYWPAHCSTVRVAFDHVVSYVLYPFISMQRIIIAPFVRTAALIRYSVATEQRYNQLVEENQRLLAENIRLHAENKFVRETQELVEFKQQYLEGNALLANITLKQLNGVDHYCIIDVGQRHGVSKDMVAIYKNNLVGRVVEVFPLFSKVVFISDRTCKVAALCARTQTEGIHEGTNEQHRTQLTHVSHLQPVEQGDVVLSSGQGLVFPRGFGLGMVDSCCIEGINCHVTIRPALDLSQLTYCHVIRKGEGRIKETSGEQVEEPVAG